METTNRSDLSDIVANFKVIYNIPQITASLKITCHTKAAKEYGVQYQLGAIQNQGKTPRFSQPMGIQEAKEQEISVNISDGGALLLRMVDGNGNELAMAKIDRNNWPSTADRNPLHVHVTYSLPVPKERLL